MNVKEAGKKGGSSTLNKYGVDYFKQISRKAAEARTKKAQEKHLLEIRDMV